MLCVQRKTEINVCHQHSTIGVYKKIKIPLGSLVVLFFWRERKGRARAPSLSGFRDAVGQDSFD
jgi:hypothetical protein